MIYSLHYLEPRYTWTKRGVAHNYHIIVDTDRKIYAAYGNCGIPDTSDISRIEVKRKNDLYDFVEHLKKSGFTESKEI